MLGRYAKVEHKEEWDFYFRNVDGRLGSFFLDLGLRKVAPIADKSNLIWVSFKMNNPNRHGIVSSGERNLLEEI